MGDALMLALLQMRGFTAKDFARFHPGGSLGKKLYLRVDDIYIQNAKPKVKPNDNITKVISEITGKRLGATAVVDENDMMLGIITDGDLRRMLEKYPSEFINLKKDIMSDKPKMVEKDCLAINALSVIKANNISQVVVVEDNKYLGIVHMHDLMREGIV